MISLSISPSDMLLISTGILDNNSFPLLTYMRI
jgi:hypothetical protein